MTEFVVTGGIASMAKGNLDDQLDLANSTSGTKMQYQTCRGKFASGFLCLFVIFSMVLWNLQNPTTSIQPEGHTRTLHFLICATVEQSAAAWHASAAEVRETGTLKTKVANACQGRKWQGFLTKVNALKEYATDVARDSPTDLIVFTDGSDVVVNARGLFSEEFESRFDAARGNSAVLFQAEPFCYLGWDCSESDIRHWYPEVPRKNLTNATQCSYFLNSGGIFGRAESLSYLVTMAVNMSNDQDAHPDLKLVAKDDQGLYAYIRMQQPSLVALDYRGLLFSSTCFGVLCTKGIACDKMMCADGPCTLNEPSRSLFSKDLDGVVSFNRDDPQIAAYLQDCGKEARPLTFHGNGPCRDAFKMVRGMMHPVLL